MRSYAVLFVAALLSACAHEATVSTADQNRQFDFTQQVPGKTGNQIFAATQVWITETFMLDRAEVVGEDRNTGRIELKAHIPFPCEMDCVDRDILFTMKFSIENGGLQLAFSDIRLHTLHTGESAQGEPVKLQKDMDAIKAELARINDGLHASLMGSQSTTYFH